MDQGKIAGELKEYFEREYPSPTGEALTATTNLLDEWFVDSISLVTTVLHLEKHYGITVERGDINAENFRNIESLSAYVVKTLGKR